MKKKLLIFMPSIESGGVEKNLFIIGNYLCAKIKNIGIITCSSKYKNRFNNKIDFIIPNNKIWERMNRTIKYIVCLLILLKNIIKDRNVLVLSFQANIYCSIICKIFNIKIIVRSNSSPSGWSKNIFKKIIFKIFYRLADENIVNSYKFKNELREKFNIKAVCIYNPLNVKEIKKKSKKKIRNIFSKNKNNLKIINIARFTDQKDHQTLLRAAKILKGKINFQLLIMGRGKHKKKIKNYILSNNLKNNVKILNYQKNPFPHIKNSNLFVLSSIYEGLPNVLLEALTLNKFVISSNCPTGPSEILDNGKGGLLFKVGNYKDLAKKIIYFKENQKICSKKLQIAKERLTRFDFNNNLYKYYKLIANYLN